MNFLKIKIWGTTAILLASLTACSENNEPVPEEKKYSSIIDPAKINPTRDNLGAGLEDAGYAASNMDLVHRFPTPPGFVYPDNLWSPTIEGAIKAAIDNGEEVEREPSPISFLNTDIAFSGNRVVLGNMHGLNIFDTDKMGTEPIVSIVCPGGLGDVSVHKNLVFFSVEQNFGRVDCGSGGVEEEVSSERFLGIRIFDISDITNPKQVAAVQTCRGSHTHTLVPDQKDENIAYIYVNGSNIRSEGEMPGCTGGSLEENPDTALYGFEIIKIPLDAPENAAVIGTARPFSNPETGAINGLWNVSEEEGEEGDTLDVSNQTSSTTNHCHDINVYTKFNIAAGACSGNGILLDISDPENPTRIADIFDEDFAYWHSANFNNDATKIIFTDEWGGGTQARCRAEDPQNWGADLIVDITDEGLKARGSFKIPGTQHETENCVSHNGSIIPVPGRDIYTQGWFSGGISVIDFTDSNNPFEIAFFDRGPISADEIYLAGTWGAYWHNGFIYGPDMVRGLELFKLKPSEHLTEAEIAAAELIWLEQRTPETQLHVTWPNKPIVAQAYLDQLIRGNSISNELAGQLSETIARWEDEDISKDQLNEIANVVRAASSLTTDAATKRIEALANVLEGAM